MTKQSLRKLIAEGKTQSAVAALLEKTQALGDGGLQAEAAIERRPSGKQLL